jgi:hypothetical protein
MGVTFDYSDNNKLWLTTTIVTLVYRNDARAEYVRYKGEKRDFVLIYFLMKHGKGFCFQSVIMGVYRLHNGGINSKKSARERIQ